MTVQQESRTQKLSSPLPTANFVTRFLPWVAAGGGLALYLLTLNHWVSLNNLATVSRVSGWAWRPELYTPLYWLVTLPLKLLPATVIPLALNLFSTVCAVLSLALLARCVALLPHDRTHEQREREDSPFALLSIRSAWLPPLLAVIVCGLQLTFWENATATAPTMPMAGSGCQMFDLLLFAYVVRCLLEFRIDERESWLSKAALVMGASMTNNWTMIGFFPAFLMALVWIKGLTFFNPGFLLRMFLWGLAGLSLYLLLPIANSFNHLINVPFWTALKANLTTQRYALSALPFNKMALVNSDKPLAVLGLYTLLPVFLIGIRWPSYFGDTSRLGIALATWIVHLFYGVLLVVGLWVSLDPQFSPRNYLDPAHLHTFGLTLLPLHFLTALSVGYFTGYFLLVFSGKVLGRRPEPEFMRPINALVTALIWVLAAITPVALLYRNLPPIRVANGPLLHQFAALATQDLPPQAVLLSDDPHRLTLAHSFLTEAGRSKDYVFVDTTQLSWPEYHRFLKSVSPKVWQTDPARDQYGTFEPLYISFAIAALARSNAIYYLHPSFGYFFENFYDEPHGLVHKLIPYPTNLLLAPKLPKEIVEQNESFWRQTTQPTVSTLVSAISPPPSHEKPGLIDMFMARAHLAAETNATALALGSFLSRSLNYWGVEMQRQARLAEAASHFQRAQELNPDNVVASINLECNHKLQAGQKIPLRDINSIREQWKYRKWDTALSENGPFDEPSFCFEQGRVYAIQTKPPHYREAAYGFDRAMVLAPQELEPRLWLAQMHIMTGTPEDAVKLVDDIHAQSELLHLSATNAGQLLMIEQSAHLGLADVKNAEAAVQTAIAKYPDQHDLLASATQVYMTYGRFTNALEMIDQQLKLSPDNVELLATKGYLCIQTKDYERAIPVFTRTLELQTNYYTAWLNRAIAFLQSDRLDEAKQDCEAYQKVMPTAYQVYFILQEIAWRKHDTNSCIRNCDLYLNSSPPPEEAKVIRERLKALKSGKETQPPPTGETPGKSSKHQTP